MYYTIGCCLRDIIRFSRSTNRDLFRKAQHHIGQLFNISMIQSNFILKRQVRDSESFLVSTALKTCIKQSRYPVPDCWFFAPQRCPLPANV